MHHAIYNLYVLQVLEPGIRSPYVNVNRWFVTCINQPQFKSVFGDVILCSKMAQFDGIYDLSQYLHIHNHYNSALTAPVQPLQYILHVHGHLFLAMTNDNAIYFSHIIHMLNTILSLLPAKKYNELFPKEKKEKAKKSGSEVKEEGKGRKQQKTTPKKKEPEQAQAEEEDDTPKPTKFVDPYDDLPKR